MKALDIFSKIYLTLVILVSIIGSYFLYRNDRVLVFLDEVGTSIYIYNQKCVELKHYNEVISDYSKVYKSYDDVLYSFKPIKYKNFIDEKYIKILNLDNENTDKNEQIFPIEKLIEAFKKAIPVYKKAVDENWSYDNIFGNHLQSGICYYFYKKYNLEYSVLVDKCFRVYYKNYLKYGNGFLFIRFIDTYNIEQSIKPRLDFMKKEVIELKKLMKKGYTHV